MLTLGDQAWGDHPHHLPRHDPLALGRVCHLLANRDFVPERKQPRDVARGGVMRDPGERDFVDFALISTGQREFEQRRCDHCVVAEHLVEIAQTEKDDRIRVGAFGLRVLQHHRREARRHDSEVRRGQHHAERIQVKQHQPQGRGIDHCQVAELRQIAQGLRADRAR